MKPITFGRADAAVMRVLAPMVRGWCWLTGKSHAALARLLQFVSLVFAVVFIVKSPSSAWWIFGALWIPSHYFKVSGEIHKWEGDIGCMLPKPSFDTHHRVVFGALALVFVLHDVTGGMKIRDVAFDGWLIFDTLTAYAITWTGRPPASVFSRLHLALPRLSPIQP